MDSNSNDEIELRVLTLNMWCIGQPWPLNSLNDEYRLEKLSEALIKEEYDVVSLQEIWTEEYYNFLRDRISSIYPHSHYFRSGWIGSGLCVFSKHDIVSTLYHKFNLNGYAHHIHKGDWYGGKSVGLVVLEVNGKKVHIYTTHLHAEYQREDDPYLAHRTAQSFELSQFVRHTAAAADAIILNGDLNIEPGDLSFRMILAETGLQDSWANMEQRKPLNEQYRGLHNGGTVDRPDNCFSSVEMRKMDDSKRVDYILYAGGLNEMILQDCEITMNEIPNGSCNYSDHVGLHAQFKIKGSTNTKCSITRSMASDALLRDASMILSAGVKQTYRSSQQSQVIAFILFFLLVISEIASFSPYVAMPVFILRFLFTGLIFFLTLNFIVILPMERKALQATRYSMEVILQK